MLKVNIMDNMPVNITDIAVTVILLISAFLAYTRGLVHEILSVAGWVGGGLITIYSFPIAKPFVREIISIELAADLATLGKRREKSLRWNTLPLVCHRCEVVLPAASTITSGRVVRSTTLTFKSNIRVV